MLAKGFVDLATNAIAPDRRLIDPFGHSDANPGLLGIGSEMGMQAEASAGNSFSLAEHDLKFGRDAQMRATRETQWGRGSHGPFAFSSTNKSPRERGEGSDAEAGAALGAATRQDLAAIGRCHASTETVVAFTLDVAGLVSALGGHGGTSGSK